MDLILKGPPSIPKDLDKVLYYKLATKEYFNRLKSLTWIFLEIVGAILILGVIWITVDWVKIIVSGIAIGTAIMLFLILAYIF